MPRCVTLRCPLCRGTLELNLDTLRVERHWAERPAGAPEEDFGALIDRVSKRAEEGLPDIQRLLEEQRRRRDEAFEEAKRRMREVEPPAP